MDCLILNCCKLEIAFKCQTNLSNSFRFKDPIPKDLISGIVYKFQCDLCNECYYGESIRHLDIRSGEHISVSPFTGKKVKPIKNSAVRDHLLRCNYSPSFDNFSILAHKSKKFLLSLLSSKIFIKFENKIKTKPCKIFPFSYRQISLAKFCQVRYIIKKQTRTKHALWMNKTRKDFYEFSSQNKNF